MPIARLLASFSLLLFTIAACQKSSAPAQPSRPTTASADSLKLNFSIDYPQDVTIELLLTEPSGKLLLDTIVNFAANTTTKFTAGAATIATRFDFTTVILVSGTSTYNVVTYKGVNPATWNTIYPDDYRIKYPENLGISVTNQFFTNLPAGAIPAGSDAWYHFVLNSYYATANSGFGYDATHNTLDVNTYRFYYNPTYIYLLFPDLGLYRFYSPASAADTISLSRMDTATALTINRTPSNNLFITSSALYGIVDTTDLTKSIALNAPYVLAHADYYLPKTPMQKYEFILPASDANPLDLVTFYSYDSTIPTTPSYLDPNSFTILSEQPDSFAIRFNDTLPTYYYVDWLVNGKYTYRVFESPDSTIMHPQRYLTALNPKLVRGIPLTTFQPHDIQIEDVAGFNFASYLSYATNPALLETRRVTKATRLFRSFY